MSTTPSRMLSRYATRIGNATTLRCQIQARRSVSSAPVTSSDVVIPPDSPQYTYIPTSPQTTIVTPKANKGILPKPRHTLKIKTSQVKWHIENTAPEPVVVRTKSTHEQHKDLADWKAEETRLRRTNFQAGFPELRKRRGIPNLPMTAKTARRVAVHRERLTGPEPFYEEMSRPSIPTYNTKPEVWSSTRRSQEETETRKIEFEKRKQVDAYERRTNLHTLYVNAKDFIVNNEQLEKRIEEVFESDFYRQNHDKQYGIWDEEGWPEDTAYLMDKTQTTEGVSAVSQENGYTAAARRRIRKVTEEMTGGKLDIEEKEIIR